MSHALRIAAGCLSLAFVTWIVMEPQTLVAGVAAIAEGTEEVGPRISLTSERASTTDMMDPGDSSVECVTVVREGTPGLAEVGIYLAPENMLGDGLERYLLLTVEAGMSPQGGCLGFAGDVAFSGSLEQFAADHSNMASAVGRWSSPSVGDRVTYRITTTLIDDNRAQGLSASATLTWGIEESESGAGA